MAGMIVDVGGNTVGGATAADLIPSVALTTVNSPVNSTPFDAGAAVAPLNFHLSVGVFTAPGTLDVKIQETVDDPASPGTPLSSGWGDITGATFTQVVASTKAQWIMVKNAQKRWVRAVATIAGGGASVLGSVLMVAQAKITGSGGGASTSPQT